MTKNLVTISLTIFMVAVVVILGAGVFANQNKINTQTNNNVLSNQSGSDEDSNPNDEEGEDGQVASRASATSSVSSASVGSALTINTVSKHNSANDCWLIIDNKVYNVTNYINLHPAGPETIIPYCGGDATVAFDTKNGKGPHSQNAQNMLNNYYIGNFIK